MSTPGSPRRLSSWLRRRPDAVDSLRIVYRDTAGREDAIVHEWPAAEVVSRTEAEDKASAIAFAEEAWDTLREDCDARDAPSRYVFQWVREGRPVSTLHVKLTPAGRDPEDDLLLRPPEEASPAGLTAQLMRHLEVRDRTLMGAIAQVQRVQTEMLQILADRCSAYEKERGQLLEAMRDVDNLRAEKELEKVKVTKSEERWDRLANTAQEIFLPILGEKLLGEGDAPKNGNGGGSGAWAAVAKAAVEATKT